MKKPQVKPRITPSSVQIDILHTSRGHVEMILNGDNPKQRKKIHRKILSLIKEHGAVVIVKTADGKDVRVTGYDPKKNQSVTKPMKKGEKPEKIEAKGTKASVIAPVAGG